MSTSRSVKASFGEDIRRFAAESTSFEKLEENLRSVFSLNKDCKLTCKYKDEEGDLITIASDGELELAFQLSSNAMLRLEVSSTFEDKKEGWVEPQAPKSTVEPMVFDGYPTNIDPPSSVLPSYSPSPVPYSLPPYSPTPYSKPYSTAFPTATPLKDWKQWKHQRKAEHKLHHLDKKMDRLQQKALKHGLARLVLHVSIPDGTVIAPNQDFTKTWRIRNESAIVWTEDVTFAFKKGDQLSSVEVIRLSRSIGQGQEIDITIPMRSPNAFGRYISVWRLVAPNGKPFGQPFHVRIAVADPNGVVPIESIQDDIEAKLLELSAMGFNDRDLNERFIRKCRGDMDRVVWKLLKKQHKMQFKQDKFSYKMEKVKRKAEITSL